MKGYDNTGARAEAIFVSDISSDPATSSASNNYGTGEEGYWFVCSRTLAKHCSVQMKLVTRLFVTSLQIFVEIYIFKNVIWKIGNCFG